MDDAVLDGLAVRGPGGQLEALVANDGHVLVGEADLPVVPVLVNEDRPVVVQLDLWDAFGVDVDYHNFDNNKAEAERVDELITRYTGRYG